MFIWATVNSSINTTKMLKRSLQNGVAYVSGASFSPSGGHTNSMRLNFTFSEEEKIIEGIKRLSKVIREEMAVA